MFGEGTLRRGATGPAVTELQDWLRDRGFLLAGATGTFDDATYHAVRAFQFSAGIGVDGAVGGGTRTAAGSFTGTAATTGWHPTAVRYVPADSSGGSFTVETRRGVLHTTETTGLPAYPNPPHFTVGVDRSGPVQLWQHYPITIAARALRHPSGTEETNRYGAIQIEIITYARDTQNMETAQPDLWTALRALMRWIETNAAVARRADHPFDGNTAYGLAGSVRLSEEQWRATQGWVGHQHVPHNTHWDPGLIDIAGLLAAAPAPATPAPTPAPAPAPAPAPSGSSLPGVRSHAYGAPAVPAVPAAPAVPAVPAAPAVPAMRPTITATRRRIDNRFPSLGFTITSGGGPYFEVILTTDRALFDPANVASRNDHNFYASRQDGGLRRFDDARGSYLTPIAVLQAFAAAEPAPTAIYYTIAGYADAEGNGAVFAMDVPQLATMAPSVEVAAGYVGHTVAKPMGVPVGMLNGGARQARALALAAGGGGGRPAAPSPVTGPPPPATPSPSVDPSSDRGEGEDGYDFRLSRRNHVPDVPPADFRPEPAVPPAPPPGAPAAPPAAPPSPAPPPPAAPAAPPPAAPAPPPPATPAPPPPGSAPAAAGLAVDDDFEYDDGWGDDYGLPPVAGALDSTFPAGAPQPAALTDAESGHVYDELGTEDEFDSVGRALANGAQPPPPAPLDGSPPGLRPGWRPSPPSLEPASKRALIEAVTLPDGDAAGDAAFAAVDPDGAFTGAHGTDHPAYQRWHTGLVYGIGRFDQDSGLLGQLLVMMRARDPELFAATFGEAADELVAVTTAPGPLSRDVPGGRGARIRPVAGHDLWEEPWLAAFRAAGSHRVFRGAQNELTAVTYLDPVLQFAADLGLGSPRGLAMVLDRAIAQGLNGARHWVIETVGPAQTAAQRAAALRALGFEDVAAFQAASPDLLKDEQFGPITHAALVAALRSLGPTSPLPVLTPGQMLDAMVQRAASQPWGHRLARLRTMDGLGDEVPAP